MILIDCIKCYFKVLDRIWLLLLAFWIPVDILVVLFEPLTVVAGLSWMFLCPAIAFAAYEAMKGESHGLRYYLGECGKYFGMTFVFGFVFGLIVLGLSFLLIIPGVLGFVYLQFMTDAGYNLGLTECGPALKKSFRLVKGNLWTTVFFQFVIFCVCFVVYIVPCLFLDLDENGAGSFLTLLFLQIWFDLLYLFWQVCGRVWFLRLVRLDLAGTRNGQ